MYDIKWPTPHQYIYIYIYIHSILLTSPLQWTVWRIGHHTGWSYACGRGQWPGSCSSPCWRRRWMQPAAVEVVGWWARSLTPPPRDQRRRERPNKIPIIIIITAVATRFTCYVRPFISFWLNNKIFCMEKQQILSNFICTCVYTLLQLHVLSLSNEMHNVLSTVGALEWPRDPWAPDPHDSSAAVWGGGGGRGGVVMKHEHSGDVATVLFFNHNVP